MEDLGVDGRLISKCILVKQIMFVWSKFIWIKIRTKKRDFVIHNKRATLYPDMRILLSQHKFRSMK